MRKFSNIKISFVIAFTYVLLATIYAYWSLSNLNSTGFLWYLFLPAIVFPTLILFSESDPMFMILLYQFVTLLIIWGLVFLITRAFRKEKSRKV